MLIPSNVKMLYFNFYSFECIMASEVQPTIDISSIMKNWVFGRMSIIEVGLFTLMCLSIDNPNKTCPMLFCLLIRLHLQCMLQLLVFVSLLYLENIFFDIIGLHVIKWQIT